MKQIGYARRLLMLTFLLCMNSIDGACNSALELSKLLILQSTITTIDTRLNLDAAIACSCLSRAESSIDHADAIFVVADSRLDVANLGMIFASSKASVVDTRIINVSNESTVIINQLIGSNSRVSSTLSLTNVLDSKIDEIDTELAEIDSPCGAASLSNANVSGGIISLATPGIRYAFTEDIGTTGSPVTITISAADVTINLDGRQLNGQIQVNAGGDRAIIYNGVLVGGATSLLATADQGVVLLSAPYCLVRNCVISSNATTGTAPGRRGIKVSAGADNTRIFNCIITAGAASGTGTGNHGIDSEGNNVCIAFCAVTGGIPATGTASLTGGNGINSTTTAVTDLSILNCTVRGGNGAGTVGAGGGNGVVVSQLSNLEITNGIIQAGTAASNTAGVGGAGGSGISLATTTIGAISDCQIEASSGAASTSAAGGAGGIGISMSSTCTTIDVMNCEVSGGNGGTTSVASAGGAGGDGIQSSGTRIRFIDCTATGGNGGGSAAATTGGAGGHGLESLVGATEILILRGEYQGGFGARGTTGGAGGHGLNFSAAARTAAFDCCMLSSGTGGSPATTGGAGGNGALLTNCINCALSSCVLYGSSGGNGTTTGGVGGQGVRITGNASLQNAIRNCTIEATGIGGTAATAGNGGDGVLIGPLGVATETIQNTEVSNCIIHNTGSGTTSGQAINDKTSVAANDASVIFGNFAYDIASATKYTIAGGSGATSGTTATMAASTKRTDNVRT